MNTLPNSRPATAPAQRWHAMDHRAVLQAWTTDDSRGLSDADVQARRAQYGPNELVERGVKSAWLILWEQLTAFLVVILIVAAIVSGAVGEWMDATAILVIVVLNALFGLWQEYSAEKAMAALKRMATPTVRVRRNGSLHEVTAKDLVPGDIVILEAGNHIPADGRIVEAANLKIQESALTGESDAIEKDAAPVTEGAALADRRSMAYLGSNVTYGRGAFVVTATGMDTELGHIADMLQSVERDPTPLQVQLDRLGKTLTYAAVAIIGVVAALEFFQGIAPKEIFLTSISMAVAAVPEGLPAVVTISLALGARRMLRRHALIRKLTAVETLGCVTVICSDKTGTLTENLMTVVALEFPGARVAFPPPSEEARLETRLLVSGSALANDAVLQPAGGVPDSYTAMGDPTEGALVIAAAKLGALQPDLTRLFPRIAEAPFDSNRKRMTTVHEIDPGQAPPALETFQAWAAALHSPRIAFTKGSVDGLLTICDRVWRDGAIAPMTPDVRTGIEASNNAMASDGIRVLGMAFKPLDADAALTPEALECGLVFVGLVGMIDPVRPEVRDAVATCRDAGIQPVMITGDHPLTARHIARELGILSDEGILTGQQLDETPETEFADTVQTVRVFARVTPEHKLRIVDALQGKGHIVAMTGDGVNDAPALRKSNIGVAMGITGTDVSKEAADMVLQDDNFATIVASVQEGRVIYDNIRRFIQYILSTNSGEIWVMLGGPLIGITLPLLPLQILWMNLVTDGLPALALAVEPAERNVMRRPPRQSSDSIITRAMGIQILWVGLLMALVTLGAGYYYKNFTQVPWETVQSMMFTIIVVLQLGNSLAVRSTHDSVFRQGFFSNPALLISILGMLALQLMILYVPIFQRIFATTALSVPQLAISLALGGALFWAIELEKWITRWFLRSRTQP